jgi:peptide/nickel transport system permease protein
VSAQAPPVGPVATSVRGAYLRRIGASLLASRSGRIGIAILVAQLAVALLAPLIAPYSPTAIDPFASFQPPSREHWFGTDEYGRDVLSRVMYGGRTAIAMGFVATSVAVVLGTILGLLLGYAGGWLDEIGTRILDAILSLPGILVLLVMVTALGPGTTVIVLALIFLYTPGVARVVRAAALDVIPLDFVTAARARGERGLDISVREIQPNVRDVALVEFAMRASWAVMLLSALSFLGFGVNPPTPDWGLMISDNRAAISIAPWVTIFPLLALSTLVIGINLTADAIGRAVGLDLVKTVAE